MATLNRITAAEVGAAYTSAVCGQALSPVTPTAGTGDLIPIGSGRGTLIIIRTAGTGCTATVDSVRLSSYGDDKDVVATLAATDMQAIFLPNDGTGRFDQGGGLAKVTCSAVTNVTISAITIP
jgi:hypothetical protein